MISKILQFAACLIVSVAAAAPAYSMTFTIRELAADPMFRQQAQFVFADGVIEEGDTQKLESLMSTNNVRDGALLYLNSPGGSLIEGLQLGRFVRKHEFITTVGRLSAPNGGDESGSCYSACSLAYLGGSYRLWLTGSLYGVHRFTVSNGTLNGDDAQIASAAVVAYLSDMGISNEFFEYMTSSSSQSILVLPYAKLVELKIVTGFMGETQWSFEKNQDGAYLRGQLLSLAGSSKLLLMCHKHNLTIAAMIPMLSAPDMTKRGVKLLVDNQEINLDPGEIATAPFVVKNNYLSVAVHLSENHLDLLLSAKKLGFILDAGTSPPGFQMDTTGGSSSIKALVDACH